MHSYVGVYNVCICVYVCVCMERKSKPLNVSVLAWLCSCIYATAICISVYLKKTLTVWPKIFVYACKCIVFYCIHFISNVCDKCDIHMLHLLFCYNWTCYLSQIHCSISFWIHTVEVEYWQIFLLKAQRRVESSSCIPADLICQMFLFSGTKLMKMILYCFLRSTTASKISSLTCGGTHQQNPHHEKGAQQWIHWVIYAENDY